MSHTQTQKKKIWYDASSFNMDPSLVSHDPDGKNGDDLDNGVDSLSTITAPNQNLNAYHDDEPEVHDGIAPHVAIGGISPGVNQSGRDFSQSRDGGSNGTGISRNVSSAFPGFIFGGLASNETLAPYEGIRKSAR